jgi:hypothetical protein
VTELEIRTEIAAHPVVARYRLRLQKFVARMEEDYGPDFMMTNDHDKGAAFSNRGITAWTKPQEDEYNKLAYNSQQARKIVRSSLISAK